MPISSGPTADSPMTPSLSLDTIVVGAGIGGRRARAAPRRPSRHRPRAKPGVPGSRRGLQVVPNATRALRALGVLDRQRLAAVAPTATIRRRWQDGSLLGSFRSATTSRPPSTRRTGTRIAPTCRAARRRARPGHGRPARRRARRHRGARPTRAGRTARPSSMRRARAGARISSSRPTAFTRRCATRCSATMRRTTAATTRIAR